MRIVIKDREYDPQSAAQATLWDLRELKRETGLSLDQVQTRLAALAELPEDEQGTAIFDGDKLDALLALIWLLRRRAGERLTLEEATNDFAVSELRMIADEDEAEAAPKGDAA